MRVQIEPVNARESENHRVQIRFFKFFDSGRNIAANLENFEIGTVIEKLTAAAQTARGDLRAYEESVRLPTPELA